MKVFFTAVCIGLLAAPTGLSGDCSFGVGLCSYESGPNGCCKNEGEVYTVASSPTPTVDTVPDGGDCGESFRRDPETGICNIPSPFTCGGPAVTDACNEPS